jgi:hypothetical protein
MSSRPSRSSVEGLALVRREDSLEAVGNLLEFVLLLAVRNVDLGKFGTSNDAIPNDYTVLGL